MAKKPIAKKKVLKKRIIKKPIPRKHPPRPPGPPGPLPGKVTGTIFITGTKRYAAKPLSFVLQANIVGLPHEYVTITNITTDCEFPKLHYTFPVPANSDVETFFGPTSAFAAHVQVDTTPISVSLHVNAGQTVVHDYHVQVDQP